MLLFHVITSSNQDRPVFADSAVQLDIFVRMQAISDSGVFIVAYCIMSSHLHLVLGVEDADRLGAAVQRLIGPVAYNINARLEQRGAIFRTFWRSFVGSDAYLWALPLYIHANPSPNASDLGRLDVGLRSSHKAYLANRPPEWLRPGIALDQYAGDYAAAMQEFLDERASREACGVHLSGVEERIVLAVARVCGTRPITLLDPTRGGKRDRMFLAWALTLALGSVSAGRVLGRCRQTAATWAAGVAIDPGFRLWRTRFGDPERLSGSRLALIQPEFNTFG